MFSYTLKILQQMLSDLFGMLYINKTVKLIANSFIDKYLFPNQNYYMNCLEAGQGCSVKKVYLKISQNSQKTPMSECLF